MKKRKVVTKMIIDIDWPMQAENFEKIDTSNVVMDSFWKRAIKKATDKNSVIFIGKRGSGKTLLLKLAESLLLEKSKKELRLPVFVSFSAFLAKFSFPKIGQFAHEKEQIASQLFNSYFHVIILKEIVRKINFLKIKPTKDYNLMGIKIRKNKEIKLAKIFESLENQMKIDIVPRRILQSDEIERSAGINLNRVGFNIGTHQNVSVETVEFSVLNSEANMRKAIEDIIDAYDIKQIIFLFDEITGLGYLQGDFFDLLYIFRDQPKIVFKIGSYPFYTDMGHYFDIPDDADSINLDRRLFYPSKGEYYDFFISLLKLVLAKDKDEIFNNIIEENALKILAIASGGNSRLFLTYIKFIGELRDKKLKVSDVNSFVEDLYNHNFQNFIKQNARRYSVDYETCLMVIETISERLSIRNKKKPENTTFIGIKKEIFNEYEKVFDLLDYSRVLEFVDEKILSGPIGRGKRYNLNVIVAASYKSFKYAQNVTSQINNSLIPHLEQMKSRDRKTIISNFGDSIPNINGISTIDPMEEKIEILYFTKFITNSLIEHGIKNIYKIEQSSHHMLQKIKGIGVKKAKMIKSRVLEYISDNFI